MQLRALLLCAVTLAVALGERMRDPYQVLGVRKSASTKDIKKQYKELAREWHPDKNSAPGAEKRFVEINQAYEILSDAEKRRRYDAYGETGEESGRRQGHPGGFDDFFSDMPFANFGGQNFKYNSANSFFAKHRISLREYEGRMMADSWRKPFILFAYADWCMSCHQVEPVWERIVTDLLPIGFGVGTANAMLDGGLVRHMRVQSLPTVVVLFEGRTFHYRGAISYSGVIKYVKDVLPRQMVDAVSDENIGPFLDSWRLNKVSVLLFGNKEESRLRYLLSAIKYASFARFGYAQFGKKDKKLRELLNIQAREGETVLIFNEKPENGPIATLSAKEISMESLDGLIDGNKFLTLPRVSSQEHFDLLCPPSLTTRNRRLCAILLVSSGEDEVHVSAFRDMVGGLGSGLHSRPALDSVRFLYMFTIVQEPFLKALQIVTPSSSSKSVALDRRDVVVLWRTEAGQAKVDWLREAWNGNSEFANASSEKLLDTMEGYVKGRSVLSREVALGELVDEYGPGLYTRTARRLMRLWEQLIYHVTKDEFLPAISVAGTIGVIMLLGYCLNHSAMSEDRREKEERAARERLLRRNASAKSGAGGAASDTASSSTAASGRGEAWMKILRELRAETYFGMIRLLKPGCRTLVVVVDEERKTELLRQFAKAVWPWRNNKTLYFGFIVVPKNLDWFRKILEYTLPSIGGEEADAAGEEDPNRAPDPRLKNINPKQVVGTVLSLNGWRLYFSMYHPKHAPSMEGYGKSAARSLGLESDESDDEGAPEPDALSQKQHLETHELLEGLPNWLERLFEGQGRRYHLPSWPEPK